MQLGLDLPAHSPSANFRIENLFPELVETAKFGERIGFSSFVLPEHHFIDYFVMPAPLVLAAHLAAITQKVRLIISVFALPLHDVRRLAGEITVADHLTNGRIELGFGRGGAGYELDRMGIPADCATDMFNEKRDVLLRLLTEKDIAVEGKFVKFPPLTIMPPPLQKPHPPIWMSVIRAEAAYHCGRNGYNVQTAPLRRSFEATKKVIQAFRDGVAEAKPQNQSQQISLGQWVYVAEDDKDAREKKQIAHDNHRKFMNLFTTPGSVVAGEVQKIDIEDTVEDVGNSAIIGTPDYCVDRIAEHRELGIDHLMIRMNFGASHKDVMGSLDRFAQHVLPEIGISQATDLAEPASERAKG